MTWNQILIAGAVVVAIFLAAVGLIDTATLVSWIESIWGEGTGNG